MSAFARAAVLAILRQHGLSKADAGAIVDEDDRAALGAFLSGRTDDIESAVKNGQAIVFSRFGPAGTRERAPG